MDISPYTSYLEIAFAVNVLFLWQGVWDRLNALLDRARDQSKTKAIREGNNVGQATGLQYDEGRVTRKHDTSRVIRRSFRLVSMAVGLLTAAAITQQLFFAFVVPVWAIWLTLWIQPLFVLGMFVTDGLYYALFIKLPDWQFNRRALNQIRNIPIPPRVHGDQRVPGSRVDADHIRRARATRLHVVRSGKRNRGNPSTDGVRAPASLLIETDDGHVHTFPPDCRVLSQASDLRVFGVGGTLRIFELAKVRKISRAPMA